MCLNPDSLCTDSCREHIKCPLFRTHEVSGRTFTGLEEPLECEWALRSLRRIGG